ncbi:cytotoxic translational repressor of toxin-antitoxin stability system [Streptococcus pneumoniae]|nr:cytotoxic translational repressor of toxin-antitoxin stability system [Streptococcus pneumoniae]
MNNLYKLVPTRRFIKQLKKLDRYTQKLITNYRLVRNLVHFIIDDGTN